MPSAHERPAEQLTATFVILEEEEKKNSPHLFLFFFNVQNSFSFDQTSSCPVFPCLTCEIVYKLLLLDPSYSGSN